MGARAVLTVVGMLVVAGCGGASSGDAACAGPLTTVSSGQVAPGGDLRVQVSNVFADCYDTGQEGTPPPARDVVISLWPEGASYGRELDRVDADQDGRIDVTVRIPDDVTAGPASLHVGAEPIPLEVIDP